VTLRERTVNSVVKLLLRIGCRLSVSELRKLPRRGPVILITNHTSLIEGPAIYVLIQPRHATALAKIELWHNRITRFLMNTWNIIPVSRGDVDHGALRACLRALKDDALLGIAPEGTRSKSGSLVRGHRGAALLALRSGAPVYPCAQLGFTDIGRNLRRLRRTRIEVRVGSPFTVRMPEGGRPSGTDLQRIADEMMYRIAVLLPENARGFYRDLSKQSSEYLAPLPLHGASTKEKTHAQLT
jgi:1-acyl-sn-glycerol-3-phosphate acyltransferase